MQFRAVRYRLRYPGSPQFDGPAISQSGRSALHGESRVSWCVQWLAEQLIERQPPDRPTRVRCCPGNEQFRSVWPPKRDPALLSANIRAPIVPEFPTGDTPPLAKVPESESCHPYLWHDKG